MPLALFGNKLFAPHSTRFSKRAVAAFVVAGLFLATVLLTNPLTRLQGELPADFGLITRVDLSRVTESPEPDRSEPLVRVHLINSSKIKASGVSIEFGENFSIQKLPDEKGISSRFDLDPGQERTVPAMPLADFLARFQSRCPGCFFLGIGKPPSLPVEITARLCKGKLDKGLSCRLEYSYYPIELRKTFTTAHGEQIVGITPLFVYLSRTDKTAYSVPKN